MVVESIDDGQSSSGVGDGSVVEAPLAGRMSNTEVTLSEKRVRVKCPTPNAKERGNAQRCKLPSTRKEKKAEMGDICLAQRLVVAEHHLVYAPNVRNNISPEICSR